MLNQIMTLSNGNPGAMMFLMKLATGDAKNPLCALTIIPKIEKCGIKGTDLYVLWSDLCGKDIEKVERLCKKCPDDILTDACSRQDYSGRELVKKFLE